jgi:membrane protease YdiL (CAAX protease family)
VAYGIAWLFGIIEFYGDEASNYKWVRMLGIETPAPVFVGVISKLILGSILISILTLGEEIGWSGFLIPKLLKITSIPTTSIIVGLIWAIWHYPAIIGGIYGYGAPLPLTFIGFTLVLIGNSFFKTYFVSKSKSLWPGAIIHASHNVITMGILFDLTVKSKYAAYFVSESGIITAITYVIGAILFYRFQMKKQLIKNEA